MITTTSTITITIAMTHAHFIVDLSQILQQEALFGEHEEEQKQPQGKDRDCPQAAAAGKKMSLLWMMLSVVAVVCCFIYAVPSGMTLQTTFGRALKSRILPPGAKCQGKVFEPCGGMHTECDKSVATPTPEEKAAGAGVCRTTKDRC